MSGDPWRLLNVIKHWIKKHWIDFAYDPMLMEDTRKFVQGCNIQGASESVLASIASQVWIKRHSALTTLVRRRRHYGQTRVHR